MAPWEALYQIQGVRQYLNKSCYEMQGLHVSIVGCISLLALSLRPVFQHAARALCEEAHTHTYTHKSTPTIACTRNQKKYFKPCRHSRVLVRSESRSCFALYARTPPAHCARRDKHKRTQTQAHTLKHNHKCAHPNCYGTRGIPGIKRKSVVVYSISAHMGALPCFFRASSSSLLAACALSAGPTVQLCVLRDSFSRYSSHMYTCHITSERA